MRVMGSQDISTICGAAAGVSSRLTCVLTVLTPCLLRLDARVVRSWSPSTLVACRQFPALMPPGWLLIDCILRYLAEIPDNRAIDTNDTRRCLTAGWRIHKRHKFV